MDFTFQQKRTMGMGFVGAATSAFGALNPIMTSTTALIGTVLFGFISACLAVVATVTSSQSTQIKNVASIQGTDGQPAVRVSVNANATPTVAAIAVDPAQPNVGAATPGTRAILLETGKGA